jgi:thioredoxin-dependent peroxiredoxin
MERKNTVTLKGNPLTLVGDEVKVGQRAPAFQVLAGDLSEKTLADFKGKIKLIASVPSLDTPVCDLEIKRFNTAAAGLSKDTAILFISADLPFAQKRFCETFRIDGVQTLSDHREMNFAAAYGVWIKELRLLARAVFVIDREDKVRYAELVRELSQPPDYQAALAALKQAVG